MIPVTVENRKFWLEFTHTPLKTMQHVQPGGKVVYRPEPLRQRRETTCRILEEHGTDDVRSFTEIAKAVASCSPKDNFCKETGRRQSLERAMKATRRLDDPLFRVSDLASAEKARMLDLHFFDSYTERFFCKGGPLEGLAFLELASDVG